MIPNPNLQELLQQGHDKLDRGNYPAALETFQQAATLEPQNPQVLYGLGLTYFRLRRYQEAVEHLNQAVVIQPNYILALARRGMAYQELKEKQSAAADFDAAIALTPENAEDWWGRGIALDELNRYEEALIAYDKAIEINPDDYNAWHNRGIALDNLKRYEEALIAYDKAIEINPDDYNTWHGRGAVLGNLNRYEEALIAYNKAIEINPDYNYAWNNRGNVLCNLNRYEEALIAFDKAIEINPDNYITWNNRGNILLNLNRYEEALIASDKAIEINPDDYITWNNRGNALGDLKRYEEALIAYDKAIEINPDNYITWNNRGNALGDLKRYEEALIAYDKAIEINPDNYITWNNRGNALRNLKRYEEALIAYDKALNLTDNQFWVAWYNRGVAILQSQGYKAALQTLDDGIKALQPQTSDYDEGCGNLYSCKGEILYKYATQEPEPFTYWFAAKASYEKALNFLSFEKFTQKHMQILQELLRVCSALGDTQAFQKRQEEATQRLEELVSKCQNQGDEITLQRKFAAFHQLRVDIRVQSTNKQEHIQALELAEARKNICLAWLREGWDYQPPKFGYQDMQRLLNPQTAAVYWHISPVAITTFIIKHHQPPIILSPDKSEKTQKKPNFSPFLSQPSPTNKSQSVAYIQQLNRFQEWMQEWKQDYQDYCESNYTSAEKELAPWRGKMEFRLLNQLRDILDINGIVKNLQDVENLILIPHRELHLLPLDYLFPGKFNITYLPSFQIGVKLITQESVSPQTIVNVTSNELPFATIESFLLAFLYSDFQQLQIPPIKQQTLISALRQNRGLFNFAGHGDHIPEKPRESFLMLTAADKLTLGDIMDDDELDLAQYELICLSACETGITSPESLTDEYVGLVSGFLAKGARYVINTLWRVNERSTAILMMRFYQLLKTHQTPVTALKEAKEWLRYLTYKNLTQWYIELANELNKPQAREYLQTEVQLIENDQEKITSTVPVYGHPYYWAGFILTGKPE